MEQHNRRDWQHHRRVLGFNDVSEIVIVMILMRDDPQDAPSAMHYWRLNILSTPGPDVAVAAISFLGAIALSWFVGAPLWATGFALGGLQAVP